MKRFAEKTSVPVDKSRAEIEQVVTRYGATSFGYSNEPDRAVILFACKDRRIRFILKFPPITDKQFKYDGRKKPRSDIQIRQAWEQSCRQKWRALLLSVKAKLESVNSGIEEFEEAFFGVIVNPATGQTIYEELRDSVKERYIGHVNTPLLLTGPLPKDGEA